MEKFDVVDKDANKTGVIKIRGQLLEKDEYFQAVSSIIVYNKKILVTKRHPLKAYGNKWEIPGGAVLSKEDPDDSIIREIMEEVGIRLNKDRLNRLPKSIFKQCIINTYLIILDDEPIIKLQSDEVIDYKFLQFDDFLEFIKTSNFLYFIKHRVINQLPIIKKLIYVGDKNEADY